MCRGIPPPIVPKPQLPLRLENWKWELTEDQIQWLLDQAQKGDKAAMKAYSGVTWPLTAIDPTTGDSVLHRAAPAGAVEAVEAICDAFGPHLGRRPDQERLLWVFTTYQNKAGDTALHSAARAGSLRGATAVYRLFHLDSFDDMENIERGPESEWPSAENWDWDDGDNEPALLFLCTKNLEGRDVAAEARAAGHEDLAKWFEKLVEQLDVEHNRTDEAAMREMEKETLRMQRYLVDDDNMEEGDGTR
ncbi:hypothetical protein F4677DRAFT_313589 [Hypoxylon crocopeplum]|nr:hypothetical protein F4677DRAFT_313589 [Hypoxylon crocopeplum]